MRHWLWRLGLAVLLAGSMATTARAQVQAPITSSPGSAGPLVHNMYAPVPPPPTQVAPTVLGVPSPTPRPCLDCLNKIGSGCYNTRNDMGCSSCYAEFIFMFGTCRQFFGEPCVPPPPSDHPCREWFGRCLSVFNGGCGGGCSK